MALEIEGVIHSLLAPTQGVSTRGSAWKKQDVIIETLEGEYSRKICVTFFGDKADECSKLVKGEKVKVSINIESREFNGKWYTNINAWKIDRAVATSAAEMPIAAPDGFQPADMGDDMPF